MGLAIRKSVYGPRSALSADGLADLAFIVELRGDTTRAIPLFREALANLTALRPPSDLGVIKNQRWLAVDLCATGAAAEGDSLIRRAIAETPADSTSAAGYRLHSSLGFCLTRQRRFAEAEPLLLDAVKGLAALPGSRLTRESWSQAARWLGETYQGLGRASEAAAWLARAKSPPWP